MTALGLVLWAWQARRPVVLALGQGTTAVWRPGDKPRFHLELPAGQAARIVLDQRGVDLVVEVEDDDGLRFEVDSPTGLHGREDLYLAVVEDRRYTLTLRDFSDRAAEDSSFHLALERLGPASPEDFVRAQAEERFHAARVASRGLGRGPLVEQIDQRFAEAASLFAQLGATRRQADALYLQGRLRSGALRHDDAVASYRASLDLFQRPDAHVRLARVLGLLGRWREAETSYLEALKLYDGQEGSAEATAWQELGNLERSRGRFEVAERHLQKAYEIFRRTGPLSKRLATLNSLGVLRVQQGAPEEALKFLDQALQEVPSTDHGTRVETLIVRAEAQLSLGRLELAASSYAEALRWERGSGSRNEAILLTGQGLIAEKRGNRQRARRLYGQTLGLFESLDLPLDAAITRNNIAWLHLASGDAAAAQALFADVLQDIEPLGEAALEGVLRFGLARAARELGDLATAEQEIEAAVDSVELLRARSRFQDRMTVLASRHDVFDFQISLLMQQHRLQPSQGFDRQALGVAEQAKARSLLDALGTDLDEDILELETQQGDLFAQNPKVAAVRMPRHLVMRFIQEELLDASTRVLAYHLGRRGAQLWVVSKSSVRSYELGEAETIELLARRLSLQLAGRHRPGGEERLQATLGRLAEIVLPPPEMLADARRLVIVPSGELFRLPFAALPWPSQNVSEIRSTEPPNRLGPSGSGPPDEPLLASFEVIYLPSSSVLMASRQRDRHRTPPGRSVVILADPVFGPQDPRAMAPSVEPPGFIVDLPRLEASAREAQAVIDTLGGWTGLSLMGTDAAIDPVLRGELADFRFVHFATHGVADENVPELSYLMLSQITAEGAWQEGRLTARQVASLELHAELVVLSACRSGPGRPVLGEGLTGLARSFLLAGARRVLVSQWSVDDQAAMELMRRFYAAQAGGMPAAEALRHAQLELRRGDRWRDVYYWGGFALFGDWQ